MNRMMSGSEVERWVALAAPRRFEIVRELGAGAMGVVYEAFDHEAKASIAIKALKENEARVVQRFKTEFRALQSLAHPNLLSLGELFEVEGRWFFTMELVVGRDFLSYVWGRDGGLSGYANGRGQLPSDFAEGAAPAVTPLDEERLRGALRQLASGLAVLHEGGMVHRDVKPTNIQVTRQGRVVLMDFGLVTPLQTVQQSADGNGIGTPEYMAPEQAVGGTVSAAADWYSVGVLLYEALTGRLPFTGSSMLIVMDKLRYEATPPGTHVPDLPRDLAELCVELLRREPEERPDTSSILTRLGLDEPARVSGAPAAWSLHAQPFVGRQRELSQLGEALDAVDGRPSVVLVEGESGIGKSALVEHFVRTSCMTDPRIVVLAGRCYEQERVSYKAFDGVADSLCQLLASMPAHEVRQVMPAQPGLLQQLFPVLKGVEAVARALIEPELPDGRAQRARLFGAFRELLVRLSRLRRLIVIIDDMQWTDADSLLLFAEVFGGDKQPPAALVLVTLRTLEHQRYLALTDALAGVRAVRTLPVEPLSNIDARELATLLMPTRTPAALETIARETGGHPLFVQELSYHADTSGPCTSLDGALQARMAALPPQAAELLAVLCIGGQRITRDVAALAAGLDGAAFARAISVLRVARLARTDGSQSTDTLVPYHDRVSEALLSTLDGARRVAVHDCLATALEQTGGDARAIVRHAMAAGQSARAAVNALVAARKANRAMAFDQAADFYEKAIALGSHDEATTSDLRMGLATALANAGRGSQAAEMFVLACEGADPARRRECQRQAAEQWLITGRLREGLGMIGTALEEIGEPRLLAPRRAMAAVMWRRTLLNVRGLAWTPRAPDDVASSELARVQVLGATAMGLSMVDPVRGAAFGAEYLRAALDLGDAREVGRALGVEMTFLGAQGSQRRATRCLHALERVADARLDAPYFRAGVEVLRGIYRYFAGQWRDSYLALTAADELYRQVGGATFERNNTSVFRVFCMRHLGDIKGLRTLVGSLCREAQGRGDLYLETTVRRYASRYPLLANNQPEEALEELRRCPWAAPAGAYHLQHWYELDARCETALYCAHGEIAEVPAEFERGFAALQQSMILRVQPVRIMSRSLRARLMLVASPGSSELRRVEAIARQIAREGTGYARLQAHLLRAAVASRRGRPDESVARLREAVGTARELELSLHLAAARRRLGRLLGGNEGASLLADSDAWMAEHEVVDPERMCEVVAPGWRRG